MTLPPLRGYNGFDAPHDDWAGVGVLGEAADHLKLGIRAIAAHLEINPVAGTADMGVSQPMPGRGVVAFVRVVEPHAGT
jgi:carbohydrate-selective porin OprB